MRGQSKVTAQDEVMGFPLNLNYYKNSRAIVITGEIYLLNLLQKNFQFLLV